MEYSEGDRSSLLAFLTFAILLNINSTNPYSMSDAKTKLKPNLALQEPSLFKIIYVNDNITTMDFVIDSLVAFFEYSEDTAETITATIHDEGSAVVAVLPYEIAEHLGTEVTLAARKQGYPLQVRVEAES